MRLIVVDGLDGCGKDTHAERIVKFLENRGEQVTVISHPSRRLVGRLSKRSLEGSGPIARLLATAFFTVDILMSVRMFKRQTQEGSTIFVRYLLGTAYLPHSLAPYGYAFFRKLLPFPAMAFFIDIEPEVAIRRIATRGHRPEMFETKEKIKEVRTVAKKLASKEWITIDNSEDGEGPFLELERILKNWLASSSEFKKD